MRREVPQSEPGHTDYARWYFEEQRVEWEEEQNHMAQHEWAIETSYGVSTDRGWFAFSHAASCEEAVAICESMDWHQVRVYNLVTQEVIAVRPETAYPHLTCELTDTPDSSRGQKQIDNIATQTVRQVRGI